MCTKYYTKAELEKIAENLNMMYKPERLICPMKIDVYDLIDFLKLRLSICYISPDNTYLGASVFTDLCEYVWPSAPFMPGMKPELRFFKANTIILNKILYDSGKEQDKRTADFSAVHECFHFRLHRNIFIRSGIKCADYANAQRNDDPEIKRMEFQSNYSTSAFFMPPNAVQTIAYELLRYNGRPLPISGKLNFLIKESADIFGVNYSPMLYRFQQLGYVEKEQKPFTYNDVIALGRACSMTI